MKLTLKCIDFPEPEKDYQPEFSMVEGQTFETKRIHVDNHQFPPSSTDARQSLPASTE